MFNKFMYFYDQYSKSLVRLGLPRKSEINGSISRFAHSCLSFVIISQWTCSVYLHFLSMMFIILSKSTLFRIFGMKIILLGFKTLNKQLMWYRLLWNVCICKHNIKKFHFFSVIQSKKKFSSFWHTVYCVIKPNNY